MDSYDDQFKRLESARLEADYWKLVLEDVLAIKDSLEKIVDGSEAAILTSMTLLLTKTHESQEIMDFVNLTHDALLGASKRVLNIVHLAEGRLKVSREESGIDELLGDDDDAG